MISLGMLEETRDRSTCYIIIRKKMILFIDTAFKETRIAIKKNDIFFQVVDQ